MMSGDDNDGQMTLGDLVGLKLPDICLTGEEKPRKNLTQETCPNRGSNPGPLRDKHACCCLEHSGGLSPSRYAYLLTREPFLIKDLRYALLLPTTDAYDRLLVERQQEREEVDEDFYGTSAMIDRSWSKPNQQMISAVNRLAVHSFHHKTCSTTSYHITSEECVCKLCNGKCPKYHILSCKNNTKSLKELSSED